MERRTRDKLLYAGFAAASLLIIFSRRTDALLNPQFWAEDGRVWYADAYNHGVLYSLLTPEAGYFQTFSRLVAIAGQIVPLPYAPLFFNLAAVGVQVAVGLFLISPRLKRVVPNVGVRLLIAFVYLALPHSSEVFANVTNSQWHLALLAFLIIIAEPNGKKAWRIFDVAAVGLSAVSGPVCLLLFPIAAIKYWQRREKWTLVLTVILFVGGVIQITSLLTHERPPHTELGVNIGTFFRIAARHLFISPIVGGRGFSGLEKHLGFDTAFAVTAGIAGFALAGYCFLKANLELRLLAIFSAMIFMSALASPAVSPNLPQWEAIASDNTALRYWFVPNFCLFVSLVLLVFRSPVKPIKYVAAALLLASLSGVVADWRNPPFKDLHFREYAAEFGKVPAGTEFAIPINPDWQMKLVKK